MLTAWQRFRSAGRGRRRERSDDAERRTGGRDKKQLRPRRCQAGAYLEVYMYTLVDAGWRVRVRRMSWAWDPAGARCHDSLSDARSRDYD